jgi:hypothetical protein
MRYAVNISRSQRRYILALLVIGTFATIFVVGIVWATSRKADESH